MADTISRLAIQVGMDTAALRRGVGEATGILSGMGSKLTGALAAITGGVTAGGIAGFGVRLAAEMEQASVAFEVMIGDARRAQSLLAELQKFADVTPFEFGEMRTAAKTLLAMTFAVEDVMPALRMLGTVSSATGQPLNEMASLFGQVAVAGRLTGNELRQFNERGIPLLTALASRFGVTTTEIRAMVEAGKIGFDDVREAMGKMFDERLLDRMGKTLSGRFSTLSDTAKRAALNLGNALAPALSKLIEAAIPLAQTLATIDAATIQNVIKVTAWAGALGGVLMIVPRLVTAVGGLIAALRTTAYWQTFLTALQGPKGWATLGIAVAAATGTAYALKHAFEDTGKAGEAAAAQTGEAWRSQATGGLYTFSEKLSEQQKQIEKDMADGEAKRKQHMADAASRGKQLAESLRTPQEEYAASLREANDLLIAGAISEDIYARAVAKAKEELAAKGKQADETADKIRRMNEAARSTPTAIIAGTASAQSSLAQRANAEAARQTAILERISRQLANAPVIRKAGL